MIQRWQAILHGGVGGPWKVIDSHDDRGNYSVILDTTNCDGDGAWAEQQRRNAILAAAAPQLLEALELAVKMLEARSARGRNMETIRVAIRSARP